MNTLAVVIIGAVTFALVESQPLSETFHQDTLGFASAVGVLKPGSMDAIINEPG